MCQSLAQGGQRCAAHTRPRYQEAQFGTSDWDAAAAAYASTPTGRMELSSSLAAAEAAEDIRSAVAFEHALTEGRRLREKAELFRDEIATRTVTAPVESEVVADDDGDAMSTRSGRDYEDADDYEDTGHVEGFGGREFTDESVWDDNSYGDWSPTMRHQRFDATDPVFAGCSGEMTNNAFVNQVCENVGISRTEFETAAAAYFAQNQVGLVTPGSLPGNLAGQFGPNRFGDTLDVSSVQFLVAGAAAPSYTPQQIKAIAERAKADRERAQTAAAAADAATAAERETARAVSDATTSTDPTELATLALSNETKVREKVASNEATPANILAQIAKHDAKPEVRALAARNPSLPVATIVALGQDRLVKVRAGAARNPNMPVDDLRRLAADPNDGVKGAVARNPSTPPGLYRHLSTEGSATVRTHAARKRDISDIDVARFAGDSEPKVRAAIANNRTTGADVLRTLATDSEQSVRTAVAKNPNLPPAMLRGRLSRDPAPGVRAGVARNPNTSVAVLTRLTTDNDAWVRRNVVWNQSTPAALLYCLAQDPDEGVRSSVQSRNGSTGSN